MAFVGACLVITYSSYALRKNNIDYILTTKAYSYLPPEAKNYIKNYYEETGIILLTEQNKEDNVSYINPEFVRYLTLDPTDQEKYGVMPSETIVDYSYVGDSYEPAVYLPSKFNLNNVDTDGDGTGDTNYITKFRNQGLLGICWSYATIETAESHLLVKNNEPYVDGESQLFSARQLDYITSNNGIMEHYNPYGQRELGSGNNFNNIIEVLASGISLVDHSWLDYDQEIIAQQDMPYVIDRNKSLYELNATETIPAFDGIRGEFDEEKTEAFEQYKNFIKEKIMENGGAFLAAKAPSGACGALNKIDPLNEKLHREHVHQLG